jgi:predicted nucleotidyltransferase component of viral defense system
MLSIENLEQFAKVKQTDVENVAREYFQHLFLSFLYQQPGSENLLFKGGTALRIILQSPRFSEDLDFTGIHITIRGIEDLFAAALSGIEKTGINVEIVESKKTTGGYLGTAKFLSYGKSISIQIEVSLRNGKMPKGTLTLIHSDYLPPYTVVHLPVKDIVAEKISAITHRHKARDFYDYFFLLAGNYPQTREAKNIKMVLKLLAESKLNFGAELKKFLPASHAMQMRNFKKILERKILNYVGKNA